MHLSVDIEFKAFSGAFSSPSSAGDPAAKLLDRLSKTLAWPARLKTEDEYHVHIATGGSPATLGGGELSG